MPDLWKPIAFELLHNTEGPGYVLGHGQEHLKSHIPAFLAAQQAGNHSTFWSIFLDAWFQNWPITIVASDGINVQVVMVEQKKSMTVRLKEWFQNHTRASTSGNECSAILSLKVKAKRKAAPWQAYMKTFWPELKPKWELEFKTYRADQLPSSTAVMNSMRMKHHLAFVISMYDKVKDTDTVKKAVEAYNEDFEDEDFEGGDSQPAHFQRISTPFATRYRLPSTRFSGRRQHLLSTAHLKNTFLQYHLDFEDHITQPFAQYLQASFSAEIRAEMALPTVPPSMSATVQISTDGTSFIISSTASGSVGLTIATLASLDTDGTHARASASSALTAAFSSSAPASATVQVTVDASTPLSPNIRATASANVTNGSMLMSAIINIVSPLHSHAANCPDSLVTRSSSYGWSRSNSFEEERLANVARNKAALTLLSNFTLPTVQPKKTRKKAAKGLPATRNSGRLSSGQDLSNDTDNSPDSQFEAANPLAPAPVALAPQVNVIPTVIIAPVPEIVGPRTPVVQSSAPVSPAPDIVNPPAVITPAPAEPMPDITALPAPIPLVLLHAHAMAPAPDIIAPPTIIAPVPDIVAPPDIIAPLAQPIPALPVPSVIEVIPTTAPELDRMAEPAVSLIPLGRLAPTVAVEGFAGHPCFAWIGLSDKKGKSYFFPFQSYTNLYTQTRYSKEIYDAHPSAVGMWMAYGWKYEVAPHGIGRASEMRVGFHDWWMALQPTPRSSAEWPFPQDALAMAGTWSLLLQAGDNGFFLIIMYLWWWGSILEREDEDEGRQFWEYVADVRWVLEAMTGNLRLSSSAKRKLDAVTNHVAKKPRT
ncbi:hypothetical protein BKA93DRAFT_828036 [Sparassis latifolia]